MAMKIRFCILAILGSLLSGVDFTLSGGILVLSAFMDQFFPELYVNRSLPHFGTFCQYQSLKLMAIALIPCAVGWCFGFLAVMGQSKCGPRTMMIGSSVLVILGGGISIVFINFASFLTGRIVLGIGMAILRQVVPIYITDVPPQGMRNGLDIAYEFVSKGGNIIGSVFIFIPILHGQNWEWRLPAFPLMFLALCMGLGSYVVPESPRYLIIRGNHDIAQRTLERILEPHGVQLEYQRLVQEVGEIQEVNQFREIFQRFNTPFLRIKLISIPLQAFLGSSILLSFLPGFLVGVGLGTRSSLVSSLIIGFASMMGMGFSVLLIHKWEVGRRMVLLSACFFMIFAQISLGSLIIHDVEPTRHIGHVIGVFFTCFACAFVFLSSMLPGPLGWLAANYPAMTHIPGTFLSRNTSTTVDFILSQLYIFFMCYMHGYIFILFAIVSIAMFGFIYYYIPETTGLTRAQMMEVWAGHWYWRRFMPADVELLEYA